MMNKKLLICGALATGVLLTACVKKEAPKEDEQEQTVEKTEQQPQQSVEIEPVEIEEVEEAPTRVEIEQQESNNTSATIRREYRDVPAEQPAAQVASPAPTRSEPARSETVEAKPKAEVKAPEPKASSTTAQSEDDAVAAAIAAATPAL